MLDFQENVFRTSLQNKPFRVGGDSVKKVHFPDRSKDMFVKSKMKHVGEYCVYLDILPMGSIYVIQSTCLRGTLISAQQIL